MGLTNIIRAMVPQKHRAQLRRLGIVNWFLNARYGGMRSTPHPHCEYQLHFEGRRNIGWAISGLQETETEIFAFARKHLLRLKPDCVWDIGANVGLWTLFFAAREFAIEKIISFEPDRTNRQLLELNRERNKLTQVIIRSEALSDKAGEASFNADPMTGCTGSLEENSHFIQTHYGAQTQRITVKTLPADELIAQGVAAPKFIKLDVEGHELSVLRGATDLLRKYRPVMVLECSRNQQEVGQLLQDAGYQLIDLEAGNEAALPTFATGAIPREQL